MMTSCALHALALVLVMLIPAGALIHSEAPKPQIDVVFHRPAPVPIPAPLPKAEVPAGPRMGGHPPPPAPKPKPDLPEGPVGPGKPDLPQGPAEGPNPEALRQQRVANAGILAFRDKFASLAQDKVAPRLGADARYGAAEDVGRASSRSTLTTNNPGSSGGINIASLSRSVGGGGGGGSGGGFGDGRGGGGGGTHATSSIAGIGGGDRPLANGPGPARTDEEIQIVFDRYKASFYRLYNRELRNTPTLRGQMVLRLTIEPDGSVSMCVLQSSDMDAPDLATQVVARVRAINFGAKEGVKALTIVYPIDFLPAV
jgi:hypothetical protein